MPPRKRGRDEMEASEPPKEMSLLERIRNMWEFASIMQFIFMFGKVVKIDEDFDIEVHLAQDNICIYVVLPARRNIFDTRND